MNDEKIARVAVEAGIDGFLDYRVPAELSGKILPGTRVRVPLGGRVAAGYAAELSPGPPPAGLRPVHSAVDEAPVFTRGMLELAIEISEHYVSPPGAVFRAMLPGGGGLRVEEEEIIPPPAPPAPEWLERVAGRGSEGHGRVYVLQGLPAKTLPGVYSALAAACVNSGRQAVFLFPDAFSLSAHEKIFAENFPGLYDVYHGSLKAPRRRAVWEGARSGRLMIVLGLRSAVFSPVRAPGLIVVHEEADFSYKSKRSPRFNAASAALMRGKIEKFPVVLAGDFPSFETHRRVQTAEFSRLDPPPGPPAGRPSVRVIDMRGERARVFSRQLKQMVYSALDENRQVVLFANRRGYANLYVCRDCGYLKRCVNCSVPLRFHSARGRLLCHYCDYSESLPETCPGCGKACFRKAGFGSQKVESLAMEMFPRARVMRLDSDSARFQAAAAALLEDFRRGGADILVDTGISLDSGGFDNVAVCGIMSADNLLNMPDFRAAENLFRFVCRAGSSLPEGASVAVQTYNPGHYAVECVASFDRSGFYARESVMRKKLGYPPFGGLACVVVSGRDAGKTGSSALGLAELMREELAQAAEVLGPVPAVVSRLRGVHRMQIVIKSRKTGGISGRLKILAERARAEGLFAGVKITIDVDPVNMM